MTTEDNQPQAESGTTACSDAGCVPEEETRRVPVGIYATFMRGSLNSYMWLRKVLEVGG